jgi:Tfp pilus assembly protein PilE
MTLSHRIRRQDGFTYFEVLIVCVVLGGLAALAYGAFLSRDKSGLDAEAKAIARGMLGKVQTCFAAREDYTLCDELTEQEPPPGVRWGAGPGMVEVVRGAETTRYRVTIRAHSRAESGGKHHTFLLVKEVGEQDQRSCLAGDETDGGGCHDGTW